MSKVKKKLSKEDEEERRQLYLTILELRAQVEYGKDLVKYYNDTMVHFKFPHLRTKGEDLIDWEMNGPFKISQLAALEKMYKNNYE